MRTEESKFTAVVEVKFTIAEVAFFEGFGRSLWLRDQGTGSWFRECTKDGSE